MTTPGASNTAAASAAAASGTASGATAPGASPPPAPPSSVTVTDQAVLDYLRKKGLGSAVQELTAKLEKETPTLKSARDRLDDEETMSRTQRSLLSKSTGGHYGYDRDSAWPVVQWGIPDGGSTTTTTTSQLSAKKGMGVDEARAYLDAFCSLQLWVLGLPDEGGAQVVENPIERAHKLLTENDKKDDVSLQTIMQELTKKAVRASASNSQSSDQSSAAAGFVKFNLPPSAKPELLSVTFALLVHTYCELLEVGMESTAHTVRDAFQSIYEPLYGNEYRDLHQCTTTEDMMRLNSHNSQHMEALATLKTILVQVASYQLRREEFNAHAAIGVNGGHGGGGQHQQLDKQQQQAKDAKISEYDRLIASLKQKYNELSVKATSAFTKMYDVPFLRRARAVRWQLTLSTTTYGLLSAFLNGGGRVDDSLLCMSTLLQTKCELHVERRNPLPFTPACVLDESELHDPEKLADDGASSSDKKKRSMVGLGLDKGMPIKLNLHRMEINWAAPMPRSVEERQNSNGKLPFPKYNLDEEYDNASDAVRDRKVVEFNRALLVNGFRRLEALERKREYDVLSPTAQKRLREGDAGVLTKKVSDPFAPSILLTTLCANTTGPFLFRPKPAPATAPGRGTNSNFTDVSQIWEEAGIGLCCAKLCEPDGRRVAVGCDDSAVRIWSSMDNAATKGEPLQVLLGHKNGFPVFDVDWNRDGRSLLSGGGDGSVRLWDTMAVGPNGEVAADPTKPPPPARSDGPDTVVPDMKPESDKYTSGAALAVYRGHAPSSPVWSVSFSPSGYYFASAGGDATARMWTTDRLVPVRLFTGHSSSNVNCVEWHPNCNYIITGSDDRTARLWDIQTGRTVRLLTGCYGGVNAVRIDPSGRHAAVADHSGVVHLWDLGTGKKITEFRSNKRPDTKAAMVHALKFSACGTALATGGDNCCVQIWDIRGDAIGDKPMVSTPTKSFLTKQTMLMDLHWTRRNLLLAAGKYVTPVPVAPHFEDVPISSS